MAEAAENEPDRNRCKRMEADWPHWLRSKIGSTRRLLAENAKYFSAETSVEARVVCDLEWDGAYLDDEINHRMMGVARSDFRRPLMHSQAQHSSSELKQARTNQAAT